MYIDWTEILGQKISPRVQEMKKIASSFQSNYGAWETVERLSTTDDETKALLSRFSLVPSRCFLKCSFRSLLTPTSWNILCSFDVYSKPHACCKCDKKIE